MAIKLERPDPKYTEQLALALNLDEVDRVETGFISPEEARKRSRLARMALDGKPDESCSDEWSERYRELLNAGWPWRVACYIAWASSPRIGRWPETQQELATEVLGLTSDRVIASWRKKNPTIDSLIAEWQALPLLEHRADVIAALSRSASNPDHRHNPDRKVFLEMTGDYTPKTKLELNKVQLEDLSQMSDAELDKLARQARGDGREDGRPQGDAPTRIGEDEG
jgi:hypothetical protein